MGSPGGQRGRNHGKHDGKNRSRVRVAYAHTALSVLVGCVLAAHPVKRGTGQVKFYREKEKIGKGLLFWLRATALHAGADAGAARCYCCVF